MSDQFQAVLFWFGLAFFMAPKERAPNSSYAMMYHWRYNCFIHPRKNQHESL